MNEKDTNSLHRAEELFMAALRGAVLFDDLLHKVGGDGPWGEVDRVRETAQTKSDAFVTSTKCDSALGAQE